MRKEGVIFLIAVAILLFLSINYYHLFNAFALFIVAGGIIGTQFSLPGWLMLTCTLIPLAVIVCWPFRDTIRQKFSAHKKFAKLIPLKRQ